MAILEYVYRVTPPDTITIDDAVERLTPAAQAMTRNNWVVRIQIEIYDDHLSLAITMKGHDRWWIRRRAPYLVVPVLTNAGLEAHHADLQDVRPIKNLKSARFWTEKHNKGSRVFLPADGSEAPPPRDPRCKACKPAHIALHETRSGWHQTYQGKGR